MLKWVADSNGQVPADAVCGGWDSINREPLFVGRGYYKDNLIVGKVSACKGCCYVPYLGAEHSLKQYEVLVNEGNQVHLEWVQGKDGSAPANAVEGGRDAGLKKMDFIGRSSHWGDTIPGKIMERFGCLFISYGGKEVTKKEYDVLVQVD